MRRPKDLDGSAGCLIICLAAVVAYALIGLVWWLV